MRRGMVENYAKPYRLPAVSQTTALIKRLRAAGFSQSEISRRSGIPQPRISRWERGDVPDAADDALLLSELVSALPVASADSATDSEEHRRAA